MDPLTTVSLADLNRPRQIGAIKSRLVEMFRRSGWTQLELVERSGVSRSAVLRALEPRVRKDCLLVTTLLPLVVALGYSLRHLDPETDLPEFEGPR